MRTPPPVLPPGDSSGGYKPTMFDRHGPDAGLRLKAGGYALMTFGLMSVMWYVAAVHRFGFDGWRAVLFTVVASSLSALLTYRVALASAAGAGGIARYVTMPSGASTPYEEQYSYQESLAARGDVAGALASYEAVISERPGAVSPRLKAAELHARQGKNPRRAAELLREVRDLPTATAREALYASSRLVDLYGGALDDPGRALVELRRIVELYPNTDVAAGARVAIARIKAERALDSPLG
ncbi:MAG: hypothetical protein ABIV10_09410 [Gemmatimonadaceae bacterium]